MDDADGGTAVRVVVAEDHEVVRKGLCAVLGQIPGIEVVAEAGDGREAVEAAARERPTVVLMDITMPELNGIEATQRIVEAHPAIRVLILSVHTDTAYVKEALRAGAAGYLLKNTSKAELETALRAAAAGERHVPPTVSGAILREFAGEGARGLELLERLSPRQREVLQLVAEGHSTKGIARKLDISPKTVETHRAHLMERLGIHDVPGLVRFAIRSGLVPLL